MPFRKRWHFELLIGGVGGITVIRNDQNVKSLKGEIVEPISSIGTPSTRKACEKAKAYLSDALQIIFKCETIIVLNRKEFEWNKSSFCRQFRLGPEDSVLRFIEVFNRVVEFNYDRGFMVPIKSSVQVERVEEGSRSNEDEDESFSSTDYGSSQFSDGPSQIEARPRKKMKHDDTMDDSIFSKKIGVMNLLLNNLTEPDEKRSLRSLDEVFLETLVEKFTKDPSAPGVPPIAVLCTSVTYFEDFDERRKDAYKYELLGGQHTATARKSVASKYPENMELQKILAEVYIGLTNDEALRLATRHNANSHFIHKMTHRDYLEACRSKLFAMHSKESNEDTPKPTAEWKDTCKRCILPPEGMGRCTMENIFAQSSFSKEAWALAVTVMNMYEDGDLKNQNLSTKGLISKPEFKQQNLTPIQCLPEDFKLKILSQLAEKQITLAEVKERATEFRATQSLQKSFCRITNTSTWLEAQRRFPAFATQECLDKFKHLTPYKRVPEAFQSFCQAALKSTDTSKTSMNRYSYGDFKYKAYIVEGNVSSVSYQTVRAVYSTYMGSALFVADVGETWTEDEIKTLVFTSKQLNTIPEKTLPTFNVALLCRDIAKSDHLKECLEKCYENTSMCYWQTPLAATGEEGGVGFTHSLGCVVIGHFSLTDKMEKDHFNFSTVRPNLFPIEKEDTSGSAASVPISVLTGIITALSFPGSTVFDATLESGNCACAALKAEREVVVLKRTTVSKDVRSQLTRFCSQKKDKRQE